MTWKGKHRKAVIILGAGATRGAVPHVVINRKRLKSPLNGDFFRVVETYVRARLADPRVGKRYDRLKHALQEEFPTRGRWPLPMETAFSLLYVSKDFPEIYAKGAGRRREPGRRPEIEDFLRLTFAVLGEIEVRAAHENLYSELAKHLDPSDCVITLNYDTVLDSALIRSGWRPASGYCLIGGASKIRWQTRKPTESVRLAGVKLLKLHGSLNWLVRGSYSRIHRVFDAKPNQILISDTLRKNERSGLIRQIIPPIYGKFFNHAHWQGLWAQAYRSILEADMIIVIGCSLVDTDFHLTGMLGHAVRERKRRGRTFGLAVLVDRAKIRRKWERVLKGNVVRKSSYRTFAHFIAEIGKSEEARAQDG